MILLLWKRFQNGAREELGVHLGLQSLVSHVMEMLNYCKTYSMIKESYNNGEKTEFISQEVGAEHGSHTASRNGSTGVPGLSTNSCDLLCPVEIIPTSLENDAQGKLNPLKGIGKTGVMISPSKTPQRISFESELTFQPKLNAMSLKLAKERGPERIRSVIERRAAALYAETESNFTFKPKVSSKSVRIVQNLKSTFMDRQHKHVEKQKRFVSIKTSQLSLFFSTWIFLSVVDFNTRFGSEEYMTLDIYSVLNFRELARLRLRKDMYCTMYLKFYCFRF